MSKLIEAAQSGDRLATLKELRNLLAERLERTKSDRDTASLSKRLMDVTAEIEVIEGQRVEPKSSLDEMKKRFRMIK